MEIFKYAENLKAFKEARSEQSPCGDKYLEEVELVQVWVLALKVFI